MSVLVTPSREMAEAVQQRIEKEVARLPRRSIIEQSLAARGALMVVRSLDEAVDITNRIAPEHLSIQVEFPRKVGDAVVNAGAIMLGANTPVAVGDYYAGPNHILPTGRRARFASPLSAEAFRKTTSVIHYSEERLRRDSEDIIQFANIEELPAHARSVEVRTRKKDAR